MAHLHLTLAAGRCANSAQLPKKATVHFLPAAHRPYQDLIALTAHNSVVRTNFNYSTRCTSYSPKYVLPVKKREKKAHTLLSIGGTDKARLKFWEWSCKESEGEGIILSARPPESSRSLSCSRPTPWLASTPKAFPGFAIFFCTCSAGLHDKKSKSLITLSIEMLQAGCARESDRKL